MCTLFAFTIHFDMKAVISTTLIALLALVGCQTETVPPLLDVSYQSDMSAEPVLVQVFSTAGKSDKAVKDAIKRAASMRQWDVTELDDGRIKASLLHRTSDSTLWFSVDNGQVKIHSVSYDIDKNTLERVKRAEPAGWIRNLHKDILEMLGLLPTS